MAGQKSMGTKLYRNTGTSESPTWTQVAHLTSIGEIGAETDEIDVTDLDSPNGFKEFIAGAKDAGSVDIAGNVVAGSNGDAQVSALYSLYSEGKVVEWKVVFPSELTNKPTWEFDAYLASFKEGESTTDSLRTISGSLRVSGLPVFTAGSASA